MDAPAPQLLGLVELTGSCGLEPVDDTMGTGPTGCRCSWEASCVCWVLVAVVNAPGAAFNQWGMGVSG